MTHVLSLRSRTIGLCLITVVAPAAGSSCRANREQSRTPSPPAAGSTLSVAQPSPLSAAVEPARPVPPSAPPSEQGDLAPPYCSSTEAWATSMAFVHMKNAGLVTNETLDFERTSTVRLASQKIGPDLWRQVHYVSFLERSGRPHEAITVNDVSREECSMGGVEVYVVSRRLGDTP